MDSRRCSAFPRGWRRPCRSPGMPGTPGPALRLARLARPSRRTIRERQSRCPRAPPSHTVLLVENHTGRFAPSPTGTLHLGNLRTALLAWLYARAQGAPFLVRIEDLDTGRVRERFEREQLADLAAIGLDWDGEPVRQSERLERYADALTALERDGLVYPCWCTRAEIREASSAPHGPLPEGHYPGTCRRLTAQERAEREASGR